MCPSRRDRVPFRTVVFQRPNNPTAHRSGGQFEVSPNGELRGPSGRIQRPFDRLESRSHKRARARKVSPTGRRRQCPRVKIRKTAWVYMTHLMIHLWDRPSSRSICLWDTCGTDFPVGQESECRQRRLGLHRQLTHDRRRSPMTVECARESNDHAASQSRATEPRIGNMAHFGIMSDFVEGTTTGKQPQRLRRRTTYEDLEP